MSAPMDREDVRLALRAYQELLTQHDSLKWAIELIAKIKPKTRHTRCVLADLRELFEISNKISASQTATLDELRRAGLV